MLSDVSKTDESQIAYAVEADKATGDVTLRFFPCSLLNFNQRFDVTIPRNWANQLARVILQTDI